MAGTDTVSRLVWHSGEVMEKWVVSAKKADFDEIGRKFGIDPVIARLIRNRDVQGDAAIDAYLNGKISDLPQPQLLKDLDRALCIIKEKITQKKRIRIIGDYDIDGVTATYILLKGLKRLGAVVDTYIPDRIADGYGIHRPLIEQAAADQIDTIVTCDNGIAAAAEIALAKEWGMTVVVTDHHEVPYREKEGKKEYILPPADAILNPKQADCPYPNKNLCGAVVAMKLVWALYDLFGVPESEKEDYLEFAAIATVGDIMELQGENRILVKEGLRRIPATKNVGLRELVRATGLEGGRITAYHVGFVLGPCINASGRLDTAARSLQLFQEENPEEAARLAGELVSLNASRKALTEEGAKEAIEQIEASNLKEDRVLVVYLPQCHESLAGIIAGRVRERYHKPAFVLTRAAEEAKGSGRSIETYSMFDELIKCADLLIQFGGHPMAAGLSIKEENIPVLRERLNSQCTLTEADFCQKIVVDVAMPVSYISKRLVEQLAVLEPFGKGNTKPLFGQTKLAVLQPRIFGKNRNVVKMQLMDASGARINGVYFGEAEKFVEYVTAKKSVSITYYPEINRYQGRETLQVIVQNYR